MENVDKHFKICILLHKHLIALIVAIMLSDVMYWLSFNKPYMVNMCENKQQSICIYVSKV